MKETKWHSIVAIFSDVVVSPWNLLIGGLLISKLSLYESILSILIGYVLLFLVFFLYGGLGHIYKKKTSELIEPIFGKRITKYGFSSLLAVGQIGWFAIISQIGGTALANLLGIGEIVGILIYAAMMYIISSLSLYKMGIVKLLITLSSASLIVFLIANNYQDIDLSTIANSDHSTNSFIWGVGIVFSSLISFGAVSPDFTSQLRGRKDVWLASLIGIFLPGIIVTTLGAILFFDRELVFESLIGFGSVSLFGYLFNVITNTDASVAIYTPANRLQYMFGFRFGVALLLAVTIGTLLALLDITSHLEIWLGFLGIFYPLLVLTVGIYYFRKYLLSNATQEA